MANLMRFFFAMLQQTWAIASSAAVTIWMIASLWTGLQATVKDSHARIDGVKSEITEVKERVAGFEQEQKHQTKLLYRIMGRLDKLDEEK